MRTSNKILLGTFFTAVLVLSVIHIALYAKYKNGNYTTLKAIEEDNFTHHHIKNVSRIVATGLENISILPSDTARLDIEKYKHNNIRFEIKDGTLIIRGDSNIHKAGEPDYVLRSYQDINIYLPSIEKITVDNSIIHIKGSKDSSIAKSYEIDLQNQSSFDFRDNDDDDTTYTYFRNLLIRSDKSDIGFSNFYQVANLQLELNKSNFHDNAARIEKLAIKLDNSSKINMQGSNLQKAELIK